ncbi:alpha/beta fold hydrolase [Streptomyces sp. NBC_01304]|uniref:alpha/beta fold hydrolase n=1 Tax=Streptomyces sp. NBC_01304 TaxID=2903818 RepID=UPI002E15B8A9|nr:alpha/beta hydrolase [Streptomyces sp. NBC_01304]
MHYERHGEGPAVLMIPGLGATAAFFDRAVADLSRDHTVVTVDLPGHGRTPRGRGEPTLQSAAVQLRGVIHGLGLDQLTLVGWSLGATLAWTYLERFGADGVRRLVSVDQSPRLIDEDGWEYAAFGSLDRKGGQDLVASAIQDPAGFLTNLIHGSFATGSEPAPGLVAELLAHSASCDPAALRSLLADALAQDWRERVGALTLPTLLVHGGRSAVYPPEVGAWLAEAFPVARLEVIETAGHLCFLEEPERFATAIRTFEASPASQLSHEDRANHTNHASHASHPSHPSHPNHTDGSGR